MRGKQIKVEVLLAAVAVLVVAGAAGMLVRPAQPPDQVLKARIGDVVWNHDLHARMTEIGNCTVCHHTERQGITSPIPCAECHTPWTNREAMVIPDLYMDVEKPAFGGKEGPPAMQVFHGKCLGCHNAMSEGPVACRDCHAQSFSGTFGLVEWDHRTHARKMEIACVDCHHKDTKAKWDGDYRSCSACHAPAKVLQLAMATGLEKHEDAKHGQCHTCHTQVNPENDPRSCTDCHAGMILPDEERAPSLEEAVHGRCMECHSVGSGKLEPAMPVVCIDCHKPDPSMITHTEVGPVLFSHKRHAEYAEWTCIDCHHTDVPGEPHIACYRCHAADHFEGIPSLAEAMQKNCLDCHEEKQAGLTTWASFLSPREDMGLYRYEDEEGAFWWDHRFHAVGLSLSCRDCHHNTLVKDGVYVTAERASKEWDDKAGAIQTCKNCHGPDGPVAGSAAEGTIAGTLKEVYQKSCIECHARMEAGPLKWKAMFELYEDQDEW